MTPTDWLWLVVWLASAFATLLWRYLGYHAVSYAEAAMVIFFGPLALAVGIYACFHAIADDTLIQRKRKPTNTNREGAA